MHFHFLILITPQQSTINSFTHHLFSLLLLALQVKSLTHSPVHPRLMLIVTSDGWQLNDAGDFAVLCSSTIPDGVTSWRGGDFVDKNKVAITAANDGRTYLYRLPPTAVPDSGQFR